MGVSFRVLLVLGAVSRAAFGVTPPQDARIPFGGVPSRVGESRDLGPADGDLPLSNVVLLLAPRDPAGLETFLARLQDPTCSEFHKWLSPEEFGRRFGAPMEDIDRVSAWLSEQRLTVVGPNAGRTVLLFSGRLADVARALRTEFRYLEWNGEPHVANVKAPTIPGELSGLVRGVLSLDDFRRARPLVRSPSYTSQTGKHFLSPADFAAIYNLEPLYANGIDGRGTTIAIAGASQIDPNDVKLFRQTYGLPPAQTSTVVVGHDPGLDNSVGWQVEGCLDVEWAGAIAPSANVVLVVSDANVPDLAALYAVDHDLADVLSLSAAACEFDSTPEYVGYWHNLWAQAAAQGISVLVGSGDVGAFGCDGGYGVTVGVFSINVVGSSPYCTIVGGTELSEGAGTPADLALYWNPTNDPVTKRSVKGQIPEVAWFDSGGGLSDIFARPAWQQVAGLDPGPKRAAPDVSLSASTHDAYLISFNGSTVSVGGTSASAPAFGGIVALLDQKLGGRQGNLNPMLYALGRAQYGGGGPPAFRDVTSGDNSHGGQAGYQAGPGYDLVTGLGSLDASAFVSAWVAMAQGSGTSAPDFSVGLSPGAVSLTPGASASIGVTIASRAGFETVASLSASGLPSGWSASFEPSKENDASTGFVSPAVPATLRLDAPSSAAAGSYAVVLTATSGATTRHTAIVVTIGVPPQTAPGVDLQEPVVLDVHGVGGSHFTSDFFALNRSATDATLLLRYVPSPGTPGGSPAPVALPIRAGTEFRTDDVIAFLGANGVLFPAGGGEIGTLFAAFAGVIDPSLVAAGSRISTPNPNAVVGGAFGTFAPAVPSGAATASADAWIYGLRENAAYRSNLAVVQSPASSSFGVSGPVVVEIQLYDGDRGVAAGDPIVVTLQPGEFHQINSVLAQQGLSNGYARVRRTSGADRFIAYGVVDDGGSAGGGTSDGSFLVSNASDGLIPVLLDVPGPPHFTTDLTLTNPTSTLATVTLTYTASTAFSGLGSGTCSTTLAGGQQLVQANALSYLRSLCLAIPTTGNQGGTLLVTGATAQARTLNPNPDASVGGTYGLSYPAVATSVRAKGEAWVYGLRQDADVRSNLAIADARVGSSATVNYVVDVFDSDVGSSTPVQTLTRQLTGGQWTQVNGILFGSGIAHGYVRIRPASGTSDFVAYGVVNDGPSAGSRTSDGSYVPMVVTK